MTESTAKPVLIISLTFVSLAACVVFTRLYTRILKNAGPDDWCMLAALVSHHFDFRIQCDFFSVYNRRERGHGCD